MQLKLISAQPAVDYYAWQVEVYLTNFLKLGYKPEQIQVVAGYLDEIPESWYKLQNHFDVEFFYYKDTMVECNYPPAIQAHILQKHFASYPELEKDAIFFHDCDFLFTRYFDFTPFLQDDKWYFSDTISYIAASYILSKGEEVLDKMCGVVGIDKDIIIKNQDNSGGAQKLMKNINASYWGEVYANTRNLYNLLLSVAHIKKDGDQYGIQVWTASMWGELWTAWKRGYEVVVPREFDFCWATCPADRWNNVSFFHNAGVPDSKQGMFFKASYINSYPFEEELDINDSRCSYHYYNIMKSVKSCLV